MTWENVTALLGVVTIIMSGLVGILRGKQSRERPSAAVSTERFVAVEQKVMHQEANHRRLEGEFQNTRLRHDEVVDGIYKAIDDLRNLVIGTLKGE
jgi:hypothetical protein